MSRPLRIEFQGAVYHVTSRGDRREPVFVDNIDRAALLEVVERAIDRFDAQVLAYCLMGNHYHFVLHTRQANLSRLMRHLNGVYTRHSIIVTARWATCSKGGSRLCWWTATPTCSRYAAMSS